MTTAPQAPPAPDVLDQLRDTLDILCEVCPDDPPHPATCYLVPNCPCRRAIPSCDPHAQWSIQRLNKLVRSRTMLALCANRECRARITRLEVHPL